MAPFSSNFEFLKKHDELIYKLALSAEKSFVPDPNTTLFKIRQLGEAFAQDIAARVGIEFDEKTKQVDLIRKVDYELRFDRSVIDAFHQIRILGNEATHDFSSSTHRDALRALQIGWSLSCWFHRTFGGETAKGFKPGTFKKPDDPSRELRELEERIRTLEAEQQRTKERLKVTESLKDAESQRAEAERKRADQMSSEKELWEELATENEKNYVKLKATFDQSNKSKIDFYQHQSKSDKETFVRHVQSSTLDPSEKETRVIIDQQLIEAGWEADTENLKYSEGARPEQNRFKAIAEWPTSSGPADYILFDGLTPVAAVEAKKKNKNVYSAVDQAKRYARDFQDKGATQITTTWGEYKIPLAFSSNGKPYLKQIEQESGIWFNDVRNPYHIRRPLKGWYTPLGIRDHLKRNPQTAYEKLNKMEFDYGFKLYPFQIEAIKAVEKAIQEDHGNCLIAMATGTGKTKTCIALVYRLLSAERFKRILFLVDRSALGEQAVDSFNETRMENFQTFSDTFGIKDLGEKKPDDDTKVHVATVQGMAKRVLYGDKNGNQPSIDQYDCIVVDECHRGYLLDRELSDTELQFRDQQDYVSKYRNVLEYFDALKIGLTATPALHTVEIFGDPVFTYSYPEAVIDGYLVDHLPPIRIKTKLSEDGIHYNMGEEVQVYDKISGNIDLIHTPDELNFDVSEFNSKVISESFNREVCKQLVQRIDPYLEEKTLIFCVSDDHADTVVRILKEEYENYMGEIEDDAIQKITGSVDKPLTKIKSYKNDRLPNIAVTVDLLTTGIDVPEICNLVFLRRVNSRILYEQMLGRATRLCEKLSKETFRIYDAVNLYKTLQKVNTMKPVVTNPNITFTDLIKELQQGDKEDLQLLAKSQFLAKLNSKKRHLAEDKLTAFETIAGMPPEEFVKELKKMKLKEIADWFIAHPGLGEILDAKMIGVSQPVVISTHEDELIAVEHGYAENQKPEDYLNAFQKFIKENSNRIPALIIVAQRPWELTRRNLKELAIELERHHFREQDLKAAWHELKNEDIAARIIGFIRQAALGEALVPWEDRVDKALQTILALENWKTPQKNWLEAIAKQMKATTIVDNQSLDEGLIKDQLGGLSRANKLFEGKATQVLEDFNRALWAKKQN